MHFISHDQWGHDAFLRGYHSLHFPESDRARAIARWLDVTPGTVHDWISGRRPPPRAVCYAIWLESYQGREAMHCQLFNEARTYAGLARSLEDAIKSQSAVLDALRAEIAETKKAAAASGQPSAPFAANDCTYGDGPRHAAAQPSSPVSYWRAPWYRRPWAYAI